MPQTKLPAADAFGLVTIVLVSTITILGLVCIYCSIYFQLQIRRRGFLQLRYFNGPWFTRIVLILSAIWWGFGEIVRLTYLRGTIKLFPNLVWQKNACKFYVITNLGFAEPSMFLMLAFLLRASLQRSESSTLSRRWNRRTIGCMLLFCLPLFIAQLVLVLSGPKFNNDEEKSKRMQMMKFFRSSAPMADGNSICMYPLLSTIILGLFVTPLVGYVLYIGTRMLSLVVNKGLRRRAYLLIFSVVIFLPLRFLLLGFSVLPEPGNLAYEAIVFLAFLMMFCCAAVGICMLVYFPVKDSLDLRYLGHIEIAEMPFDDYY